ncbi:hypothetical protein [Bacillus alkalicellulosilyticus]|nr:hypothetical protein [Bacillus alkalicellulosilyticus]
MSKLLYHKLVQTTDILHVQIYPSTQKQWLPKELSLWQPTQYLS